MEARIEQTEHGLNPTGPGWFVVNARDVRWWRTAGARIAAFGEDSSFDQLGVGIDVLGPGQPMAAYHWETDQEDFVVLAGSGSVVLDGEEHRLEQWDVVHCPPGTAHVIVGGPMTVLAVGARERHAGRADWGEYVADPVAAKYGAAPKRTTTDAAEAYAGWEKPTFVRYGGWLDWIRNLTEIRWGTMPGLGIGVSPQQDEWWEQIGLQVRVLGPGDTLSVYHRENDQEDFLVLSGEGTLLVEGEERPLRQWDFFHCPPGVAHAILGGPLTVLAVGARGHEVKAGTGWGSYPVDELARRYGVGVEEETDDPDIAYARFGEVKRLPYGGWLE